MQGAKHGPNFAKKAAQAEPKFKPEEVLSFNIGLYKTEVMHENGPWKELEDVEAQILTGLIGLIITGYLAPLVACLRRNVKKILSTVQKNYGA